MTAHMTHNDPRTTPRAFWPIVWVIVGYAFVMTHNGPQTSLPHGFIQWWMGIQ
tara:strand:- start:83 stop:241 length:159 start_codon:yes stop_codon:yes gene_type:complete